MINISASQLYTGGYRSAPGSIERSGRAAEALIPTELVPVAEPRSEPASSPPAPAASDSLKLLEDSARKANAYLARTDTQLEFHVGEKTGRIIVKIIDKDTQEVIRTIPPEEMTRFSEQVSELRGLLFDAQG